MGLWETFSSEVRKTLGGSNAPAGIAAPSKPGANDFVNAVVAKNKIAIPDLSWDSPIPANETEAFWQQVGQDLGPGYAQARRMVNESGDVPVSLRPNGEELPADLVAFEEARAVPKETAEVASSGQVDPSTVMSFEGMPAAPETTAASIMEPGLSEKLSIPSKASRAKLSTKTPAQAAIEAQAAKDKAQPSSAPVSQLGTDSDPIANLLEARRSQLGGERDDALAKAKAQENMSDEETLATALIGILPGLIGLIGGAAAGGGYGAAAGAAGGLQGSAQGIQTITSGKEARRKEALVQAEKAGDRLARVGDQELSHAEGLQQQAFTSGEAAKTRSESATQNRLERDARAREGSLNRVNALKLEELRQMGNYAETVLKQKNITKDQKLTEQQERTLVLLPTMQQANYIASQLERDPHLPQRSALLNTFNSLVPEGMKTEGFKAYRNPASLWTGSYLFKVSGAAVPETEIERYSKSLFAQPGDSQSEINRKQAVRTSIEQVMASTLTRAPQDVQAALIQAGIPPELATYKGAHTAQQVSPRDKEAINWARANPGPDADAILQLNGLK